MYDPNCNGTPKTRQIPPKWYHQRFWSATTLKSINQILNILLIMVGSISKSYRNAKAEPIHDYPGLELDPANMKLICRLISTYPPLKTLKPWIWNRLRWFWPGYVRFGGILGQFRTGGQEDERRRVWNVKSGRSNISQNLKYFSEFHDLANMKVVRCGFCPALMTRKHLYYWEETTISEPYYLLAKR